MNKKNLVILTFVFAIILGLSFDANAQRRKRSTRRSRAAAAKAQKLARKKAEIKKGAESVAIQIKNVSKFVYVLGGIARGIEDIDKDVKAGKASSEIARKNEEFKANVIRSIRALRAGLVKIEVDFRAKPNLRPFLFKLEGISLQSGRAEDLALSGQFHRSGKELLLVVEALADTLVAMP